MNSTVILMCKCIGFWYLEEFYMRYITVAGVRLQRFQNNLLAVGWI